MKYKALFKDHTLLAVLDQLSIAIFVADADGYVIWNNRRSEEGIGIQREKIKGKHVTELEAQNILNPSLSRLALERKSRVTRVQELNSNVKHFLITEPIYNEKDEIEIVISLSQELNLENNEDEVGELKELLQTYISQLKKIYIPQENSMIEKLIIGNSKAIEQLRSSVSRVADLPSTVLLTGETGVGKSYTAQVIHQISSRRSQPFISLNCGTIPDTLLESELFGYAKGAFTGASQSGKTGLVEAAEGGTLFLDEISELPYPMQVKMLELVQEKTYLPIGSTKKKKADIRIIAATNQSLETLAAEKKFRQDLYYRLNVLSFRVPSLRERREDIPTLAYIFLQKVNEDYEKSKRLSNDALNLLTEHHWPGNIRELENTIERSVVFSPEETIEPEHLPFEANTTETKTAEDLTFQKRDDESLNQFLERVEAAIITRTVDQHANTRDSAKSLGLSQPTLVRRLQKYRSNSAY